MPRTIESLGWIGNSANLSERQTDRFTLRMVRDDGVVLMSDGNGLWAQGGCSFYGKPPHGWDEGKAEPCNESLVYEFMSDYS